MKISKLFHWLYAILMLLPFLVFLPNAFYYGFNEHAVAQEKTEQVPIYYESNEVNSVDDLIEGNIYRFSLINYPSSTVRFALYDYKVITYQYNILDYNATYTTPYIYVTNGGYMGLVINNFNYNNTYEIGTGFTIPRGYIDLIYRDDYTNNINLILNSFSYCPIQYVKDYLSVTTSMSITDSMSYAWDSVWQNDLFSWSYGSFLTEPFIYIGNVFNVPNDNSLYYALSYWLDISIIWLCFDMVMYIPLLVHRWLDKGIIE